MGGYVKKIERTLEFDGQQISVTLKPLLYADLLLLRKDEQEQTLAEYGPMLGRYVEHMSPITDSDGGPVTLEDIGTAAYFAPLLGMILRQHVEAAQAVAVNP